MSLIANTFEVC